jgi:hypothetical protein
MAGAGNDFRCHVAGNRFGERGGAVRGHGANNVALRQDAEDRVAGLVYDGGADAVLRQSAGGFRKRHVRRNGHDLAPFFRQDVFDVHDLSSFSAGACARP